MENTIETRGGEQQERDVPRTPRIYVASLSDYNAGRLHGSWLAADDELEALQAGVVRMLSSSPEPGAEEWAIHDYENFGAVRLDEYTPLEAVSRLAQGIKLHGTAYGHWADYVRFDTEQMDRFEYVYCGTWDTLEEWLQDSAIDFEVREQLDHLPDWFKPYVSIDFEALGRDMAMDAYVVQDEEGVHVFEVV